MTSVARKISSPRSPELQGLAANQQTFSSSSDDDESDVVIYQEPETSGVTPFHAIFMASFYGGFGCLCVLGQTWVMCRFMNVITDPLGLERLEVILERKDAQRMMQLVGLPFIGLAIYYLRQRDDAAFLRSTIYGRFIAGGIGISSGIAIQVIPSACWMLWFADIIPASILIFTLGDKGKEIPSGAIHPIHGLWGSFFYLTFGGLGATRNMRYLVDFAALFEVPWQETTLEDLILPDGAQDVLRLTGLPLCALGGYYFFHRGDRDFMLSSVYARLVVGGIGIMSEVLIFQSLTAACWFLWVLDVVPALLCFRALWNAGLCSCSTEQGATQNSDVDSELSAEV